MNTKQIVYFIDFFWGIIFTHFIVKGSVPFAEIRLTFFLIYYFLFHKVEFNSFKMYSPIFSSIRGISIENHWTYSCIGYWSYAPYLWNLIFNIILVMSIWAFLNTNRYQNILHCYWHELLYKPSEIAIM
jgi:hypothetical protein